MADWYQLHDFLSLAVESRDRSIREGYKHYLRFFRVDHSPGAGVQYVIRDFSEFRLPSEYRHDGPYVSFASGFLIPKEHYAVVFRSGVVEEYTTYANRATNLWIQTMLVSQGVSLVHGAGGSIRDTGLLLAGFGGVGKTLLISELIKRTDFRFFGDDYVMLSRDGEMYAYPTDFSIYSYHRAILPELQRTQFARYLTRRKVFAPWYEFQRAVNFVSRRMREDGQVVFSGWNAPYVKVPAEFLIAREKIGSHTRLATGVFLSRSSGKEVCREEISADDFAAALMGNLLIELQHALPYVHILHAFGLFDVADFLTRQRAILAQGISGIQTYRILIPLDPGRQNTAAIIKQLDQIV